MPRYKINDLIEAITSQDNSVSTIDDTLVNVATSIFELVSSKSCIDTTTFTTNLIEHGVVFDKVVENIAQEIDTPINFEAT